MSKDSKSASSSNSIGGNSFGHSEHTLVVIAPTSAESESLCSRFVDVGSKVIPCTALHSAEQCCLSENNPLLVILPEDFPAPYHELIDQLLEYPPLHRYALLVIGHENEKLERRLASTFANVEWLTSLSSVSPQKHFADRRSGAQKAAIPALRAVYDSPLSIDFNSRNSGGAYARAQQKGSLSDSIEMVSEPARAFVREFEQEHETTICEHVQRVHFCTGETLRAADALAPLGSTLASASVVYGVSIPADADRVFSTNLLAEKDSRRDFGKWVTKSAESLEGHSDLKDVGSLVYRMGTMLQENSSPKSDLQDQAASLLIGYECMDRRCWSGGHWNPHAAQRFLRSVGEQEHPVLSELTLCCITKLLVNSFERTRSVRTMLGRSPEDEKAKQPPRKDERSLSLSQLEPGMRLSRPVLDTLGKTILPVEMTLDETLIWKLWTLAAIRPIRNPVFIVADIY